MDGLQVKYSELLSLSAAQLFYENKVCGRYTTTPSPDIRFVPSADTMAVMKRLGMVYRDTGNTGGFTILVRTNGMLGPNELLRFPPRSSDKLSFFALLKNPDMLNFSELPVTADAASCFYFSNEVPDVAAPRTDLHLSKLAGGVSAAADMIKKSEEVYRYQHPAALLPGSVKVKHLASGAEVPAYSITNNGAQSDVTVNLGALPCGVCRLVVNGTDIEDFYYTGVNAPRSIFGVVEFHLSPLLVLNNYRITEADKTIRPDKPQFTLSFSNRSTTWRYTVNLLPTSPLFTEMAAMTPAAKAAFLTNLKITSNDPAVTFTQSSAGDKRIVFESDTVLPLREKYTAAPGVMPLRLTLKKNTGAPGEAAVRTDLPYPSTASLDAAAFPAVYSDIFLTL